ncbi:MAG: cytochrome c oxidase assembly protein [Panacagrimonas sp.]
MIRPLPTAMGLGVLACAWLGPLPALATTTFSAHMAMHVSVVALAAPLLALGIGGSSLDPARRWPGLFAPLPASIIELVVIWAWHSPALHHLSQRDGRMMSLEQGLFLLSSLLVWLSAFGGPAHPRDERAVAGIGGLLMTSMHMTLLGTLLTLSLRPLYPHGDVNALGRSALDDQQLGGMLMLLGAGSSYLIGALWLLAGVLRRRTKAA